MFSATVTPRRPCSSCYIGVFSAISACAALNTPPELSDRTGWSRSRWSETGKQPLIGSPNVSYSAFRKS